MNSDYIIDLESIVPGQSFTMEVKITESMVKDFADLSGDYNPLHLDEEFAKKTRFKNKIVHGALTTSYFSSIFGNHLPGNGSIILELNYKFMLPILIDDIAKYKVTASKIDYSKRIILFTLSCNVKKNIVIDGNAKLLCE